MDDEYMYTLNKVDESFFTWFVIRVMMLKRIKGITHLAGEPIRDTLTTMPTSAKNNEAYIKDACEIENTTVSRDKGGAVHTSSWSHVPNQVSSHSVYA